MRRAVLCAAFLLSLLSLPVLAHADGPPAVPTALSMSRVSSPVALAPGAWINQTSFAIHLTVQYGTLPLNPQVEIEPTGTAFTGTPNASGPSVSASGPANVIVHGLQSGETYHWQARVADSSGAVSPWVAFTVQSSDEIGIDTVAPSTPSLSSPSNPNQRAWYHNRVIRLHWHAADSLSGIAAYAYHVGRRAQTPSGPGSLTSGVTLAHLGDGVWVITVRARDGAGNWGPNASYTLHLDRHPAVLTWLSPSRMSYDPYQGLVHLHFLVSKPAAVHFNLYRVGSRRPVTSFSYPHAAPGRILTITWTGRNRKGRPVRGGYYFFAGWAADHAGNVTHRNFGGIALNPTRPTMAPGGIHLYPNSGKVIIIALSQETMYAYQGQQLVLKTYVTTGNRELPTPVGSYSVMARYSPYEFISPWPQGSPYWYAPSWVHWALLFRSGGYFIHDAPWRSEFGPGSNLGTEPGTNGGGSHGCVNTPPRAMAFLWNWTPIGTPVDVVP